jgi:TonB family protein
VKRMMWAVAIGVVALPAAAEAPAGNTPSTSALMEATASRTDPRQDPARPVSQPPYPAGAFARGEQGAVVLKFTVRADGTVDPASVAVAESSGSPELDGAAVEHAGKAWRFVPATESGRPVAAGHMFRVVFRIDEDAAGTRTPLTLDPALVKLDRKFVADARTGVGEDKRRYQEGKADGVFFRFHADGSASFQSNPPGKERIGAWDVACGSAEGKRVCVARYFKLEVMLVKDQGWVVALRGQPMSVCPIAFFPRGRPQDPMVLTVQEPSGAAVFPDRDGTGIVKNLTEMESFAAPCGIERLADPDLAMTPASFAVVRRYMEWVLAGQPGG